MYTTIQSTHTLQHSLNYTTPFQIFTNLYTTLSNTNSTQLYHTFTQLYTHFATLQRRLNKKQQHTPLYSTLCNCTNTQSTKHNIIHTTLPYFTTFTKTMQNHTQLNTYLDNSDTGLIQVLQNSFTIIQNTKFYTTLHIFPHSTQFCTTIHNFTTLHNKYSSLQYSFTILQYYI